MTRPSARASHVTVTVPVRSSHQPVPTTAEAWRMWTVPPLGLTDHDLALLRAKADVGDAYMTWLVNPRRDERRVLNAALAAVHKLCEGAVR